MIRKLAYISALAAMVGGCATSSPAPTRVSTAASPVTSGVQCGAPLAGGSAYTLEGFGGPVDTQLIMTRQQPRRQCVAPARAHAAGTSLSAR